METSVGSLTKSSLTVEAGDPEPNKGWTPEGVRARFESYVEGGRERSLSSSLQKLRHAEGRVQRALGFLGIERSRPNSETLRRRLNAALTEQKKLEKEILPIVATGAVPREY